MNVRTGWTSFVVHTKLRLRKACIKKLRAFFLPPPPPPPKKAPWSRQCENLKKWQAKHKRNNENTNTSGLRNRRPNLKKGQGPPDERPNFLFSAVGVLREITGLFSLYLFFPQHLCLGLLFSCPWTPPGSIVGKLFFPGVSATRMPVVIAIVIVVVVYTPVFVYFCFVLGF